MYAGQAKDALLLLRSLSGTWADRYAAELLLPQLCSVIGLESRNLSSLRERLSDPFHSLQVVYGHYAFSRRGNDRAELSSIAVDALQEVTSPKTIRAFLSEPDPERLWNAFVDLCAARGHRPMEPLNRGVIAGFAELAQEIYRHDGVGSIASWVAESVISSGRIENVFMRLVEIKGVGPKISSLLLRDMLFLHHLEDQLDFSDRIYVQPIDKWIRGIAPFVVPDLAEDHAPDWILAGKVAKHTRKAGVSGIRFNMGATFFGVREVRVPEALPARLSMVARPEVRT
jgi:hypothetical protein